MKNGDHFGAGKAFLYAQKRFLNVDVRRDVQWHDLKHLETQQEALLRNLQAFLAGQPYHHVLLWGARGTGKSSLLRALFLKHESQCVLIQILHDELAELPYILWQLAQEALPFMVYIDDLSFSSDDERYRSLKSVLDGAICGIPRNVMLLVSSNRRHLLSQKMPPQEALHPEEDIEEHASLSERFGLRLAFHALTQNQYLDLLASTLGVLDENMQRRALQFALRQGSRSGRVAAQFIAQWQQEKH